MLLSVCGAEVSIYTGGVMKLILSIFIILPTSAFANDCPGFLNYVKANSQLKQVSNSQIQCFVTKPPKQHIKVFTFTSGNVTVACTRSGSYPYRQLSCSDGGRTFGRSLNN
ncbi:hypothetical protein AOQ71_11015 [Bradyrhizobium manausense]|uniref:Uncharacterized protein n=1 Tax=Bradyrhizobium manausense TaxID=989370 RepID=A0A0R3E567_9BRAD|nr:hypothetical protein AOQ71_11015 [Bradyrhizobium manausense]